MSLLDISKIGENWENFQETEAIIRKKKGWKLSNHSKHNVLWNMLQRAYWNRFKEPNKSPMTIQIVFPSHIEKRQ